MRRFHLANSEAGRKSGGADDDAWVPPKIGYPDRDDKAVETHEQQDQSCHGKQPEKDAQAGQQPHTPLLAADDFLHDLPALGGRLIFCGGGTPRQLQPIFPRSCWLHYLNGLSERSLA